MSTWMQAVVRRAARICLSGVFVLVASGCVLPPVPVGVPATDPNRPVSSNDVTAQPAEPPTPSRGEVEVFPAQVESLDILILESFPVQINVQVRGLLPGNCAQLGEASVEQQGDTFQVSVPALRPRNAVCTRNLVPFETNVSLPVRGLAAGTYTVDVNGVTGTFTLEVDNVLPE